MADDIFVYTPPPDPFDEPLPPPPPVDAPRRFGGLGRARTAILLTAGLLLGGGIGGYVIVTGAAVPSTAATSTFASTAAASSHPCPNMGHGSSSSGATSAAYSSY